MMPLSMVKAGETNIIRKIGGKEEVRKFFGKSWICDRWGSYCSI